MDWHGAYPVMASTWARLVERVEKREVKRSEADRKRLHPVWKVFTVTSLLVVTYSIAANRSLVLRNNALESEASAFRQNEALLLAILAQSRQLEDSVRRDLIADITSQVKKEVGLIDLALLRKRQKGFVALNAYDDKGVNNYGTADYLGNGYFITVKHGITILGQESTPEPRKITSISLKVGNQTVPVGIVDMGNAKTEVDPGDWAIVRAKLPVDIPQLPIRTKFHFESSEPIFRMGNDYSKGIILANGYVGQVTANGLVTSLTDGHPGVSGGGVINLDGELVGIPVGRMQGDFRFSFILPLRSEMFRKVPHLRNK